MTGNTGVTPERYEHLILSVAVIDDPESDTFMRGFAYGRFTKLDSELARHWGVGRGFAVDACPVVDEPANFLSASSPNHAADKIDQLVEGLREARRDMALMHQNCVGCAQNHHGHDFAEFGMPGWLADTQGTIDKLSTLIASVEGGE